MQGNVLYLGFAAIVQLSVAFDFGLLYIFKNNRFVLKSLFGELYQWSFFQNRIKNAKKTINGVSVSKLSDELNCRRGALQGEVDVLSSAYPFERICDNLAMTGIVSGLYSVLWLLLVPWSFSHGTDMENLYMTFAVSTFFADIWAARYAHKHSEDKHTRTEKLVKAFWIFFTCTTVGCVMLGCNIAIPTTIDFDIFFLFSVIILPFCPIIIYLFVLLCSFLYRLTKVFVLLYETVNFQIDIDKHLNRPINSRVVRYWSSLVGHC